MHAFGSAFEAVMPMRRPLRSERQDLEGDD
jgi:hypothetical protein